MARKGRPRAASVEAAPSIHPRETRSRKAEVVTASTSSRSASARSPESPCERSLSIASTAWPCRSAISMDRSTSAGSCSAKRQQVSSGRCGASARSVAPVPAPRSRTSRGRASACRRSASRAAKIAIISGLRARRSTGSRASSQRVEKPLISPLPGRGSGQGRTAGARPGCPSPAGFRRGRVRPRPCRAAVADRREALRWRSRRP